MVLGLYHIRLRGKRRISQQALPIPQRLTGDDGSGFESNGNGTQATASNIHRVASDTPAVSTGLSAQRKTISPLFSTVLKICTVRPYHGCRR
jgi:hypothetical protein